MKGKWIESDSENPAIIIELYCWECGRIVKVKIRPCTKNPVCPKCKSLSIYAVPDPKNDVQKAHEKKFKDRFSSWQRRRLAEEYQERKHGKRVKADHRGIIRDLLEEM